MPNTLSPPPMMAVGVGIVPGSNNPVPNVMQQHITPQQSPNQSAGQPTASHSHHLMNAGASMSIVTSSNML